jgi:hypothetical protein
MSIEETAMIVNKCLLNTIWILSIEVGIKREAHALTQLPRLGM